MARQAAWPIAIGFSSPGGVTLRQQNLDRFQPQRAQAGHHVAGTGQERLNRQRLPGGRFGRHHLKPRDPLRLQPGGRARFGVGGDDRRVAGSDDAAGLKPVQAP